MTNQAQTENLCKGTCSICGHSGIFNRSHKSIREGYTCPNCNASLRYRHQASTILGLYGNHSTQTIAELVKNQYFKSLCIYEPGIIGPFRKYFNVFPGYYQSYFWDEVRDRDFFKGIRRENLEYLTFEDDFFDMIITSDIFEHIRKPTKAFEEIYRVLKPGGYHIFTIPMTWPLPEQTVYRVDTQGTKDIHKKQPIYHGSPLDKNGSLVYTDFGMDIIKHLENLGFETAYQGIQYNLTFYSKKTE